MNFNTIATVLGTMAFVTGSAMLIPLVTAIVYGENEGIAVFALTAFLSLTVAFELKSNSRAKDNSLAVREGVAITGLGWLMVSLLGMLPYLLGGYLGLLDSFTESVSGFTGTGATVINDVEILPRSLLLWRSLTNWIGGLGIIVIFMAILPQMGQGAMHIFRAESTTAGANRQFPRIRDNALALFSIYLSLTSVCAGIFVLCGLMPWSAINHALTTIATGGFSIYNNGIIGYNNPALEMWLSFFMLISSVSFTLYLMALRHGKKILFASTELRFYLAIVVTASILISADLVAEMNLSVAEACRYAIFQVTSISSTTAFVTYDFDLWPSFTKGILIMLMFMGGCAGSTSGGLKIARVVLLGKLIKGILWQKMHPQMVYTVEMNGQKVPWEIMTAAGRFFFAYVMVDIMFAAVMIWDGIKMTDAVGVAVSTLASVGPGFGLAGAMSNYSLLPPLSKMFACVVMFLGRLEIFTVLALFSPEFWRRDKGW